jgi:hypothetical protein
MPKVKTTVRQKLSKIVNKYPKYLSFDATLHLLCTLCQVTINYDENHISSHFNGKKHREKVENNEKSQQHILNAFDKSEKSLRKNEYFEDLANAFLSADIPFEKLLNQKFKSFLEKYTKKSQPHPCTLRTTYVEDIYKSNLRKIRKILADDDYYIMVDETQDVCQRYMVNVLIGSLNGKPSKAMLIKCQKVENANNTSILQVINSSLCAVFKDDLNYDKLKLLVTDQAKVMLKVGEVLQHTFPYVKHITCLNHALHRVCENIRDDNPLIDKFISLMKKILRKSAFRQQLYKTETHLPLPPKTVLTRWGTWISTAIFYSKNYQKVCDFINNLSKNTKSKAVVSLKTLISLNDLSNQFIELSELEFLIDSINKLETGGLRLKEQLDILENVKLS